MPGPGQYTLNGFGLDGRKYSLQGRTPYNLDHVNISKKKNVPGPGHYDPKTGINKVGVYALSTIQ